MNFIFILYIVTIASLLFLSLAVFLNDRSRLSNRLFAGFMSVMAVWMLCTLAADASDIPSTALRMLRFAVTIGNVIPLLFLLFGYAFARERLPSPKALLGLLVAPLLLTIFSFSDVMIYAVEITDYGARPHSGPLYIVQTIYTCFYFAVAYIFMHLAGKFGSLKVKNQVRYMQLALLLLVITNATITTIFVNLDGPESSIIGVLPSFLAFNGLITFAIVKHRLFDVRAVIARAVAYFLLLISLGLIYAGVAATLSLISMRAGDRYSRILLGFIASLVMALCATPLYKLFNRLTTRFFYRAAYSSYTVLQKLSEKLVISKPEHIGQQALNVLCEALQPSAASFFTVNGAAVEMQAHFGKVFSKENVDVNQFLKQPSLIMSYEQQPGRSGNYTDTVMLLSSGDAIEGMIILAPKQTGGVYTNQDIELLKTAAINIGLALVNAKKFVQIERFSKKLKIEVAAATRDLRLSNHKLEQANQVMGDFISMASHQLRPKLTATAGFLDLLDKTGIPTASEQSELLGLAKQGVERMSDIVVDMLDISNMESQDMVLNTGSKKFDIVQLVSLEIKQVNSTLEKKRITLEAPTKPISILGLVDAVKIREVMANLLHNAVQYSDGVVVVRLTHPKSTDYVKVIIVDHGIGMTKDEQKRLFEKFYRSDGAKRIRPMGSGIGLYASRLIVEAHGGSMIVRSKKNKGSEIGFTLPLKRA